MTDVSFLRFLNISDSRLQREILSLVRELGLEELPAGVRVFDSRRDFRQSRVSFAAERALFVRRNSPFFRPYYKPDLSVFEPFYQQLELFPQ